MAAGRSWSQAPEDACGRALVGGDALRLHHRQFHHSGQINVRLLLAAQSCIPRHQFQQPSALRLRLPLTETPAARDEASRRSEVARRHCAPIRLLLQRPAIDDPRVAQLRHEPAIRVAAGSAAFLRLIAGSGAAPSNAIAILKPRARALTDVRHRRPVPRRSRLPVSAAFWPASACGSAPNHLASALRAVANHPACS